MAEFIQAVAWLFGPGLATHRIAHLADAAPRCGGDSGLFGSHVLSMFCRRWVPTLSLNPFQSAVRPPDIGTCTQAAGSGRTTMGSGGRMRVSVDEAPGLRDAVDADGAFRGEIAQRAKMGTNSLPPPR